jgi:hypothetical protein
MPAVSSSAILRIGYDEPSHELRITFVTGNAYAYFDVPRIVYERFLQASSKGTFFNENIKDRYAFTQTQHSPRRRM